MEHGIEGDVSDEPAKALLQRAHAEYRRRYNEMSVLCDKGLVNAVIPAMGNMRQAKWLDIRDGDRDRDTAKKTLLPQEVINPDLLYEQLLYPVMSWANGYSSLGTPPVHIVPELLLAAEQRGVRITGLMIRTPPLMMAHLPDKTHAQLRKAVKHLKALHFQPEICRASNLSRTFW